MLIDDHIAPCLSPPSFPILPSSALLLTSAIGFLPPSTISFGDHQLWDLAARCSRLCRAYYVGCSSIPGEDLNAQPQTLKFQGPSSSKPFNSCLKFQVNTIQAQVFSAKPFTRKVSCHVHCATLYLTTLTASPSPSSPVRPKSLRKTSYVYSSSCPNVD
jgi:hypothetical protein